MIDDATDMSLKRESAILLGSFAKGTEENVANLIDSGCISVLLKGENEFNSLFIIIMNEDSIWVIMIQLLKLKELRRRIWS